MLLKALIAGLHVLALAFGLGSVYARGQRLRELCRSPNDARALTRLFLADSVWGISALIWITTGLLRAFGGFEKTPAFYLGNGFFWVKMGLFLLVFALEILPMVTFVRWRLIRARGDNPLAGERLDRLIRLNDTEVAIVLVIPFVAALMSRGAWLF